MEVRIFAHIYIYSPRSLAVVPPGRRQDASSETEQKQPWLSVGELQSVWKKQQPLSPQHHHVFLALPPLPRPPVAPAPVRCSACPSSWRHRAPSQAQACPPLLTPCSHRGGMDRPPHRSGRCRVVRARCPGSRGPLRAQPRGPVKAVCNCLPSAQHNRDMLPVSEVAKGIF